MTKRELLQRLIGSESDMDEEVKVRVVNKGEDNIVRSVRWVPILRFIEDGITIEEEDIANAEVRPA